MMQLSFFVYFSKYIYAVWVSYQLVFFLDGQHYKIHYKCIEDD